MRRARGRVNAAGDWILPASGPGPGSRGSISSIPHAPYDAPTGFRGGLAPYDAEVAYTDAMLGSCSTASRRHALDRTLVVVTADHGESLGEHGETTHGLFAYDATLAVPC